MTDHYEAAETARATAEVARALLSDAHAELADADRRGDDDRASDANLLIAQHRDAALHNLLDATVHALLALAPDPGSRLERIRNTWDLDNPADLGPVCVVCGLPDGHTLSCPNVGV